MVILIIRGRLESAQTYVCSQSIYGSASTTCCICAEQIALSLQRGEGFKKHFVWLLGIRLIDNYFGMQNDHLRALKCRLSEIEDAFKLAGSGRSSTSFRTGYQQQSEDDSMQGVWSNQRSMEQDVTCKAKVRKVVMEVSPMQPETIVFGALSYLH